VRLSRVGALPLDRTRVTTCALRAVAAAGIDLWAGARQGEVDRWAACGQPMDRYPVRRRIEQLEAGIDDDHIPAAALVNDDVGTWKLCAEANASACDDRVS
jgi:hypothetical protein